jgi:hypothetical protein
MVCLIPASGWAVVDFDVRKGNLNARWKGWSERSRGATRLATLSPSRATKARSRAALQQGALRVGRLGRSYT